MLKKTTIAITLIFTAILFHLAYKYNAVGDFKFAYPKEFVPFYEAAANQFWLAGKLICIASLLWVNIVAFKTKQLFWLWIPFLFTAFVAIMMSYHNEELFHFKKANGMWNGGFSLSYFLGVGIIVIAAVVALINYFALKNILRKK